MIRGIVVLIGLLALGACSGGSQYSSQRAQVPQTNYVPLPPADTTQTPATLSGPVAITPGATPIIEGSATSDPIVTPIADTQSAPVQTAVLTGPVAITPGAVPVTDIPAATPVLASAPVSAVTAAAPVSSLKPPARGVTRTAAASSAAVATPVRATRTATPTTARKAVVRRRASGPIYSACMNAGRKAATSSRCACVQRVADAELSSAQQRRGAGYFRNQQKLQDVRQSDVASNEAFWTAWKAYGQKAGQQCRGS